MQSQTKESIVIVGAKRTPIGAFNGTLSAHSAPELGAIAIRAAVAQAGVDPATVDEAIMGLCLFAGVGQHRLRRQCSARACPRRHRRRP